VTQLEHARLGKITPEMRRVAAREGHLTAAQVRDEVAAGRMVIPANRAHLAGRLDPTGIGRAATTKINANLGASPLASSIEEELAKLDWAVRWSADTAMDLSTGGDLDACREAIVAHATVPIGTVPIYSMIVGRKVEELTPGEILREIAKQARQGVDFFTIHAGVLREHVALARRRLLGIVSRGGSLLAKWMAAHGAENPMYTLWDEICGILRQHDVTFSIGDGLRPGSLADASDAAQFAELRTLGELTERAWRHGCQVMVEGPGHVPFDQIEYNMKLQRRLCHGAPFYVLGPLVTDVGCGYDHITGAIGGALAAYFGADFLCYVTPSEHLGLPDLDDVRQGVVASRLAAHAADLARRHPGAADWDRRVSKARAGLDWDAMIDGCVDPERARRVFGRARSGTDGACTMCGEFCAIKRSKETLDG
jgi:phosphomethylpyrimidine synthase